MIQHLQRLPTEVVERFLEVRDAKKVGIPPALAEYILQVNEASNLLRRNPSITECARVLQKSYPILSISTCKARIYDAINYFNADCSVTSEAWNMFHADTAMRLMEVALVAHNFTEARKNNEDALAWRLKASANAINPDRIKFKPQIVSADMELERMGIKKKGILIAYERGKNIIAARDISSNDKERLKGELTRELGIEDADFTVVKE